MPWISIKVQSHVRTEKAADKREACRLAFGLVYDLENQKAMYKIHGKKPTNIAKAIQGPQGWFWMFNDQPVTVEQWS